jgi:hypothetical protein
MKIVDKRVKNLYLDIIEVMINIKKQTKDENLKKMITNDIILLTKDLF